jgi:hypothetical protein
MCTGWSAMSFSLMSIAHVIFEKEANDFPVSVLEIVNISWNCH